MTIGEALNSRLIDEGISIYSMSTEEMRKVNEIISDLLQEYRECNS